jgi:hypothetical protein
MLAGALLVEVQPFGISVVIGCTDLSPSWITISSEDTAKRRVPAGAAGHCIDGALRLRGSYPSSATPIRKRTA